MRYFYRIRDEIAYHLLDFESIHLEVCTVRGQESR